MPEETTQKPPELVFFLGAGASVYAGVPDTFSYVEEFKNSLGQEDRETVEKIESTLKSWQKKREEEEKVDIELLMEILDKLANKNQEPLLEFYQNKKFILSDYSEKSPILEQIKEYVKQRSIVPESKIKYLEPLLGFIQEYNPLDIFSVNYDICVEQFCNVYKKTLTDGFDIQWNPKVFSAKDLDICLYKLHGSITWYKTTGGSFFKSLIKSERGRIELLTGEKAEALMLYPLRKWEYAEPLLENLLNLKNRLQSNSCKYVVVVGYSFRDNYIRDIFWDAASRNRELVTVFVDPNAYQIYSEKLEYYDKEEKTPSSLRGRVVCLPFHFESVFPSLKDHFIRKLKNGITSFDDANTGELRGEPFSGIRWLNCLASLADSLYVDRLEDVLINKLGLKRELNKIYDAGKRLQDIAKLNQIVNDRMDFLLEILFKRCFAFYVNGRAKEGDDAFLDFATSVFYVLHTRLSVSFTGNGFQLIPNYVSDSKRSFVKDIDDIFNVFVNYRNFGRYNRVERLANFVQDISDYLLDWTNEILELERYIALRKQEFSEDTDKINQLFPSARASQNNPQHGDVQAIKSTVLKIERKIVKDVIEEYVPISRSKKVIGEQAEDCQKETLIS